MVNLDSLSKEQARELLMREGYMSPKEEHPVDNDINLDSLSKEEALDLLRNEGYISPEEYTYSQRALQAVYGGAKTVGGLSDLILQSPMTAGNALEALSAETHPEVEAAIKEMSKHPEQMPSATMPAAIEKLAGRSLEPTDVTGSALVGAGEFLPVSPMSAASGAASGISKYYGANPMLSDLLSAFGTPWALHKLGRGAASVGRAIPGVKELMPAAPTTKPLTSAEKYVGKTLAEVSEESPDVVAARIREHKSPIEGYQPTLAEVSEVPGHAQLQRMREGISGTGLAEAQKRGNEVLVESIEGLKPEGLTGNAGRVIQEGVFNEEMARRAARKEKTSGLLKKVNKNETIIEPTNLYNYMEEQNVAGGLEKNLNYIKKLLKEKSVPEDVEYAKFYARAGDQHKHNLKTPVTGIPSKSLFAIRKDLSSEIKRKMSPFGGSSSEEVTLLKGLRRALSKDLKTLPENAQYSAEYAKQSKPVNRIASPKELKRITDKNHEGFKLREEKVTEAFTNEGKLAPANARRLVEVLGPEHPGIQELRGERAEKFLEYVAPNGTLSPAKVRVYMKNHGKALKEVMTHDQMDVINGVEKIAAGKHYAAAEGAPKNSATYSYAQNALNFSHGWTMGALRAAASKVPYGGKLSDKVFDYLLKLKKESIHEVLDRALIDPEYAAILMENPFKSEALGKRFINIMERRVKDVPLSVTGHLSNRKEEED